MPYVTGPDQWDGTTLHLHRWTSAPVRMAPSESVFVTVKGAVGKVFPGTEAAIGRDLVAFVPHAPMTRDFWVIALEVRAAELAQRARGHIPGISRRDLLQLQVDLPPLAEQLRIVELVTRAQHVLDEMRGRLERAAGHFDRLQEEALGQAFSGRLTEPWRRRAVPPGAVDPTPSGTGEPAARVGRYGLALGNPGRTDVPGWRWTALDEVARLESGHTPSRSNPAYWDGGIPWVGIKDARAHHGGVIEQTLQTVSEAGVANSSARLLPADTVCLSRTASIGYVVRMARPMCTSQDFVNWTCGPDVEPRWLQELLVAERDALRSFGRGTTHHTIYFSEVRRLHVLLPPVEEQREVVRLLDERLELVRQGRERVAKAHVQLKIMERELRELAVSGRFATYSEDDEPAGQLLARLRARPESRTVIGVTSGRAPLPSPGVDGLLRVVVETADGLSPEDAFRMCGYTDGEVPRFYADVRAANEDGLMRYDRERDRLVAR